MCRLFVCRLTPREHNMGMDLYWQMRVCACPCACARVGQPRIYYGVAGRALRPSQDEPCDRVCVGCVCACVCVCVCECVCVCVCVHSTAQHSTAQHSPAQHSTAQPSSAQPNTAQPSSTQPSPAQPSPAKPSQAPTPLRPPTTAAAKTKHQNNCVVLAALVQFMQPVHFYR